MERALVSHSFLQIWDKHLFATVELRYPLTVNDTVFRVTTTSHL